MKKIKKFYSILLLVIMFATCLFIRSRMIPVNFDETFNQADIIVFQNPAFPFEKIGYYTDYIYMDDNEMTLEKLYNESELIVIVEPTTRRQDALIVKTTSKVHDVLKGQKDLIGEDITVFEQYYIDKEGRIIIDSGCTIPMKLNNKYILFLKYSNDQESGNLYQYSSLLYGKYPIKDELDIKSISLGEYESEVDASILDYDVVSLRMDNKVAYLEDVYKDEMTDFYKNKIQSLKTYEEKYLLTYKMLFDKLRNDRFTLTSLYQK